MERAQSPGAVVVVALFLNVRRIWLPCVVYAYEYPVKNTVQATAVATIDMANLRDARSQMNSSSIVLFTGYNLNETCCAHTPCLFIICRQQRSPLKNHQRLFLCMFTVKFIFNLNDARCLQLE